MNSLIKVSVYKRKVMRLRLRQLRMEIESFWRVKVQLGRDSLQN